MEVRALKSDEAAMYVALRREMLDDAPWAFGASPEDDTRLDANRVSESLHGGANAYAIIGAFDGELLIGTAVVIRESKIKTRHRADVFSVYVTPSHRGKGIAAQLIAEAKRVARTWQGVNSLRLSVSVRSPAARKVYERAGFVAWGIEPACLCVEDEFIDEMHMLCLI